MKKLKLGILYGGKSAEHEVSLRSARNVMAAISRKKYNVVPIFIDKEGIWHRGRVVRSPSELLQGLDAVFPVLHGTYGEDGTVQGLLKLAGVPFVGAGVLGSAVGMDKDVMKRLLRDAGLPIAKFLVFKKGTFPKVRKVVDEIGLPFFVKPANTGSSVGISKIHTTREFKGAVKDAFRYDTKIIVEEFIEGREIECSVLGNDAPIASLPGEIIPRHEFYSYEAKYLDPEGAELHAPVKLPSKETKTIQRLAIEAFKALECAGMARVDFFLTKGGKVYLNEINTIPGFTSISMYPKLWEASGINYSQLIDRLIRFALERHSQEKKIKTTY